MLFNKQNQTTYLDVFFFTCFKITTVIKIVIPNVYCTLNNSFCGEAQKDHLESSDFSAQFSDGSI